MSSGYSSGLTEHIVTRNISLMFMFVQGRLFQPGEVIYVGQQGPFYIGECEPGDPSWKYTVTDADNETMIWGNGPWIEEAYLHRPLQR